MIEGYGVKTMTDKQRIAALESQLASKDQTIAKLCKDLAIANSKLAEAEEFLAPLMRDGYDHDWH